MEFRLFLLSVKDRGRGWGQAERLGFWSVWLRRASVGLDGERPEGYVPRTLFDNFIGRKRDVDGGVLAGFSRVERRAGDRRDN